ncbi:MAG TPA: hypothetical protein PLK28_04965 [Candidatus Rifleibacterium sp.]|nr:hypothetical protein [Candidatus Rifleibacterium sp.]
MTEKNIKTRRSPLPLLFICLLLIAWLIPAGMAAEEIRADYSGWSLTDAFADLATKARINIVCTFPDQKNGFFRLNEAVYFEEGISLLAKINNLKVRRNGNIWVIASEDLLPETVRLPIIIRNLEFRQLAELGSQIEMMKMPEVSLWFPPKTEIMAAAGSITGIHEIKKLKETLDTPVHALQISFYLKKAPDETLASCTFNGVSNQPFSLTFTSETSKEKISIAGTPSLNDDGQIRFTFVQNIVTPQGRKQKSDNIFMHHQTPVEHSISVAGAGLIIGWQISVVQLHGRIAPATENRSADMAPGSSDEKQTEKNLPLRHYTEISHSTSEPLEKPLTLKNADISATLADLARQQKIRLICDSSVSGTISAFCFDASLDHEMLLKTIAMTAGGLHEEDGITFVGNRRAIADMQLKAGKPVFSEPLKTVAAASAAFMLNSFFKEAGVPGRISPVSGNRVAIVSNRQGTDLAISICEDWASEPPQFNIGITTDLPAKSSPRILSLQNGKAADLVYKTPRTRMKGELTPSVISRELGLLNIAYRLEISYQSGKHLQVESSSQIAASSPMLLLHSQIPASEKIYLSGNFSRKFPEDIPEVGQSLPDTPAATGSDEAFDSEF